MGASLLATSITPTTKATATAAIATATAAIATATVGASLLATSPAVALIAPPPPPAVERPRHVQTRAYFFQQLFGHFREEARRRRHLVLTMQPARFRVRQIQPLHGARDADIAKTALFFQPIQVRNRALVREQAFFQTTQEHDGELQPLGRMQRHHLHRVLTGARLRFAAFQHGMRQERVQRVHGFAAVRRHLVGLERTGGGDEFVQVLHAGLALAVLFLLEMLAQAGAGDDMVHLLMQGQIGSFLRQLVHQLQETGQRLVTLRPEHARAQYHAAGFPQGRPAFTGRGTHQIQRARADAARRQVHHAFEGRVFGAVRQQTQISERILHFGALEEPQTTVNAVRNTRVHETFFQHAGLRVGTVKHRDAITPAAVRHPFAHALHHEVRFVAFVEGRIHTDGLAGSAGRP